MPQISGILIQGFKGRMRLLCIFPLLQSLSLKTVLLKDNTPVHTLEVDPNNELSSELNLFIDAFSSEIKYYRDSLDEDASYRVVSILSLLPALSQSHLAANQIIRRSPGNTDLWRSAFKYCDEHGESAYSAH